MRVAFTFAIIIEKLLKLKRGCCDESIINTRDLKTSLNNKKIYGKLESEEIYKEAIIDFISGMTDSYAIKCFNDLISF